MNIGGEKLRRLVQSVARRFSLLLSLAVAGLVVFGVNMYYAKQYGINIFQYLRNSMPLTEEERQWLATHTLVFGADNNSPPLRYVDPQTGEYTGTTIDILSALSKELGYDIELRPYVFHEAFDNLNAGETNMFDMFPSRQRRERYLFSSPLYKLRAVILAGSENTSFYKARDLRGRKVAVPRGDFAIDYFEDRNIPVDWVEVDNVEQAILLLLDGKVEAVVGDEPVILYYETRLDTGKKNRLAPEPLYEESVAFAVLREEVVLQRILNKAIFQIHKNQTIESIQRKWFGLSVSFTQNTPFLSSFAVFSFGVLLLLLLLFYLLLYWNRLLGRAVLERTEELHRNRNELEAILDSLAYMVAVIGRGGAVTGLNRPFCHFYGLAAGDILGTDSGRYGDMLYSRHDRETIWKRLEATGPLQYEFHKGGCMYVCEVFAIAGSGGELTHALHVIKDVTEIRVTQDKLLHAEKLAHVGQLAAGVAHEIRNPLGIIKSHIYILKKYLGGDERPLVHVGAIDASVDRAAHIVDNLLDYSRPSGDPSRSINVNAALGQILELYGPALRKNGIRVGLRCGTDATLRSSLDGFSHIMTNLISNAILAMPDGGDLDIDVATENGRLTVTVSDTGVGIAEKDLDNLFYPFFTTRNPSEGTGLGLYVAHNAVKQLGGEIAVRNREGGGSVFTVTLPNSRDGQDGKEN